MSVPAGTGGLLLVRLTAEAVEAASAHAPPIISLDISSLPKHAKAIALALKKYGMFMADNGGNWRISVAPDRRIRGLNSLQRIKGRDFEVVITYDQSGKPQY